MTQTRQSISRNWTCNYFICAQKLKSLKTLKCGFPVSHFHPPPQFFFVVFCCCCYWLMQKSSRHLCKVTCMFFCILFFVCFFEARRPAGGPGEAAGQAAAAVGEEVRPSAHGTSTPSSLRDAHVTLCSPKVRLRPTICCSPLSQCDVGEQCAVRKGARIGKLCDCPRGALCNFYLLKCLWTTEGWWVMVDVAKGGEPISGATSRF